MSKKNRSIYSLTLFCFCRYGSGKTGTTSKFTPTPPLSAKGPIAKPKSSGKKHKIKSHNKQEKTTNLSSPYAFSLSATPPAPTATNQGIPLGQSLLVVTIKDKTVKVHMPSDSAPRSPTLVECKAIIKHQQETNKRQEQEVCVRTNLTAFSVAQQVHQVVGDLNRVLPTDFVSPRIVLFLLGGRVHI